MVVPAAMTFDLDLAPKAAGAVALLVTGGLIDRLFERRPKLLVYYGHVASFQIIPEPGAAPVGVNSHARFGLGEITPICGAHSPLPIDPAKLK